MQVNEQETSSMSNEAHVAVDDSFLSSELDNDVDLDVSELVLNVLRSKDEISEKKQLVKELRKLQPALQDRWIYRNVV